MIHPTGTELSKQELATPLLRIENLVVSFPSSRAKGAGERHRVRAVNGIDLTVYPRQTLAVVGESGCGKSVTSLSILRLVPMPPGRFDSGVIHWRGEDGRESNLLSINESAMRKVRGNQIAMIFQEPMTSLNPVYTIGDQIMEAIFLHRQVTPRQAREIAIESLNEVGIAGASGRLDEYPHQMSGGMRQRIMIAMALACQPRLLLADEPTTALDVTIQAQILELLRKLQQERNMAVLLITHDLGVVAENADTVAVMYAGRVVEFGSVHDVFNHPLHPYTQGLFSSMPVIGKSQERLVTIPGSVPDPTRLPDGCPFHPRCSQVNDDPQCTATNPPLLEVRPQHWAACWHTPEYAKGRQTKPDLSFRRDWESDAPPSPAAQAATT
ncbi:MAG: ABC transporter ATP-binding protein [Phycisphaeraceae bacterium]|nr:ABC transporter ATP-binding protein [Phycisphaeraceae bacterium]